MADHSSSQPAEQVKRAAEAFVYGFPLVYNLREFEGLVKGTPRLPVSAPTNEFACMRSLAGPDMKFVSPNNDTIYLLAICDVRRDPLVLHVPDTENRYYVLQFVDAWTNNFAYIGRRATGTAEAHYLLAAQDYAGDVPHGMTVVRAPTGMFVIVGRIAVDGAEDLPAVHALQDQFSLTPLQVFGGGAALPLDGFPKPSEGVRHELAWWEAFRVALAAFPPPAADAPFLAACEALGLTSPQSSYINPSDELAAVLVEGEKAGHEQIEQLMKQIAEPVNGWQSLLHIFDYNLDFFGVGTIDAPEWKMADRKTAYLMRSLAARAGLWGNHGYEANYPLTFIDADNQPLTAEHRYELHLAQTPPVDAFWSLTMYDASDYYLVANAIDRYSIGDRTPGLQYGADGSVTIYIQKDSPGPDKESNWLPAPQTGRFRPLMRMYQPKTPVLNGTYVLPAIRRLE